MASWSCLPPEIKQHVVKRLDFMSRHSLRHTSRLDRQIVDSTKCQVPRVRFGYKEGRGLIVVYTGIDQFLRWEFGLRGHNIVIHKFDSTYDLNLGVGASINFEKKNQDKVGLLLHFIFRVFHFLFASSAIHIRVMEFELSGIEKKDIQSIRGILYDMIKMLTERIGVLALCGGDTEVIFALASYFKGYKGKRRIQHFDMIIYDDSLVPVNSQSNTTMMGRSISETTVYVMDSDYLPTQYRALTDEDNNMPDEYKTHPLLNTLRIPNTW
uniref:F-box domain-containing protein n=1 Tax=Caenorhabditis tropicalis TaxID=1561998 RepID=A0A1I7UE99_9PELO